MSLGVEQGFPVFSDQHHTDTSKGTCGGEFVEREVKTTSAYTSSSESPVCFYLHERIRAGRHPRRLDVSLCSGSPLGTPGIVNRKKNLVLGEQDMPVIPIAAQICPKPCVPATALFE